MKVLGNGILKVKLNVQAAEEELKIKQKQLSFDVAQAFYGLLATMEFVKVSQSTVDLAKQQLSISQKLFDSGASTNFDGGKYLARV